MHDFKVGDLVGYVTRDPLAGGTPEGKLIGPHCVVGLEPEDKVRFASGSWMPASRLVYWPGYGPVNKTDSDTDSWDYAEARRLQEAANAAVEAYNEYIKRKPADVFPEVFNPFQG